MKVEIEWNEIENNWWFDLGLSYQKTQYHRQYENVVTVGLGIFSIYVRW